MPAVLAVDPGSRYVGVAVSNPERTIALPIAVLAATPQRSLVEQLRTLARERNVDQLVVGRPLALRGTPLPMTAASEALAELLGRELSLPVELLDERLSTKATGVAPGEGGGGQSKGGMARVDAQAAAIFLQTYLDAQQRKAADEAKGEKGNGGVPA